VIAIELAFTGALFWQIRFFDVGLLPCPLSVVDS
jgi:hypothetical protein